MFMCDRCGSSFSASRAAAIEHCPRCQARDQVEAPLSFKMFDLPSQSESVPSGRTGAAALPTLAEKSGCQSRPSAPTA